MCVHVTSNVELRNNVRLLLNVELRNWVILLKRGHFCDMEVENLQFDIFYFLYCR